MKKMTANFYPAQEEKNGHIGWADITIASAIRLNGISVFRNKENGTLNINFPEFGDGGSYVVPKSKEAYAEMLEVVAMAVESEKHFGYNKGEYRIRLEVQGKAVNEPYADGRFSVDVGDVCTLYGITTRPVEYEKDGQHRSFVAINLPNIGKYEKDGETQYRHAFEGRTAAWTDKEGKDRTRDYGQLLNGLVFSERKELLQQRKPALEDQLKDAENRKQQTAKDTYSKTNNRDVYNMR